MVRTTGISVRTIVVPDLPPTPWKTHQKAWFRASHICRRHTALSGNKPITQQAVDIGVARLEGCLTDIYTWMSQNKLKLNADKTEVLVLGTPKQRAKISVPSISVNGETVKSACRKNPGGGTEGGRTFVTYFAEEGVFF